MKISSMLLAAMLFTASSLAFAAQPPLPRDSDSPVSPPRGGGATQPKEPPMDTPSDSGIVVAPPTVDPKAIKTPPRNIDPKINDATGDIDRKNREKSADKMKSPQ